MILRWLALLALICSPQACRLAAGALVWDQTTVLLTPKSTDQRATAQFKFQNTGKEPVFINRVQPDCSCVTAPLAKTLYGPGEHGTVTASFAIGHQTGDHTVTIEVKGAEGDRPFSSVLILQVKIVDVVVFSPRFLYWKNDEPLSPKTVEVTLRPGEPLALKEIRAGNPAYTVKLSPTDDPRHFTLLVTPPTPRARSICPITVVTESPDHAQTHEHGMVARVL